MRAVFNALNHYHPISLCEVKLLLSENLLPSNVWNQRSKIIKVAAVKLFSTESCQVKLQSSLQLFFQSDIAAVPKQLKVQFVGVDFHFPVCQIATLWVSVSGPTPTVEHFMPLSIFKSKNDSVFIKSACFFAFTFSLSSDWFTLSLHKYLKFCQICWWYWRMPPVRD